MYNKRTQLNINIKPDSLVSLKSLAIRSGKTLGILVNDILSDYIDNDKTESDKLSVFIERIDSLENKIEIIFKKLSDKK